MAQNTHNVQNIDSRDGQKTKERQPLFYHTSVQDDNPAEYFFFISNEPPHLETIANDVLSVNKLNILDFNCKNVLTCGPLFKEIENHVDIYLLQEHWLFDCQRHLLNEISDRFSGVGKAVDRPYSSDPNAKGVWGYRHSMEKRTRLVHYTVIRWYGQNTGN